MPQSNYLANQNMDDYDYNSAEPSSLRRLNDSKNHHNMFTFQINSLNDREFLAALRDPLKGSHARNTILTVPIREDNIKAYKQDGRSTVTMKDAGFVLKSEHRATILDFLHSLDDNALLRLSSSDVVRDIIDSDYALSQRHASIEEETTPRRKTFLSARYNGVTPPVFSLDTNF